MSAFSEEIQRLSLLMRQKTVIGVLTQLQVRQQLEPKIDQLLMTDELNVKDETTINVFGYVVKKAVKVDKDLRFMSKFLDNFKFFKDLRQDISHDLYIDMLKKIMWQVVEPNEFIFSKSNEKKKTKASNNFYIIIEGEVMEFQQLYQEEEQITSKVNSQNHINSFANLSQHNLESQNNLDSPNNKNSSKKISGQNSQDSLNSPFQSKNPSSKKISQVNSPSKRMQDSILKLNQIDESMKRVIGQSTPKNLIRKNSSAFLDKDSIEDEKKFIKSINEYIENFKNDKRIKGNASLNSWKFLSITSRAINNFKNKISPLKKQSSSSLFGLSKQDNKGQIPSVLSRFQKLILEKQEQSPYSPFSPNFKQVSDEDKEAELLIEVTKNFFSMKLRKILKKGDNFGEFDEGNLNLAAQGYMAKNKGYLVYLSGEVYNDIISRHQIQIVEKKIRFLQQFSFFKNYSKQKLKNYLKYFENATYYRGNIVYQELDPANLLYFIISGEIEFSRLFKLQNQITPGEQEEKIIPIDKFNAQDFDLNFNPFEKQEKEIYQLNQGKQNREKSKLIKRIHSFIIGPNQYFGEKEVLTNCFRLTQAQVISVKLEVLQLPSQIYYDHFYCPEIHEICLEESQMREIEQLKIFNQIQARQPHQNIVEKLENDYLNDFAKNNRKTQIKLIDNLVKKIPPFIPFEVLKKKVTSDVANYKDKYLSKKEFNDLICKEQMQKTNRYIKEIRECKISFLSRFMSQKSKFSTPADGLPFYNHVKTYVDSVDIKQPNMPLQKIQESKVREMLNYCQKRNPPTPKSTMTKDSSPVIINHKKHRIKYLSLNSNEINQQTSKQDQSIQTNQNYFSSLNKQKSPINQQIVPFKRRIMSATTNPMGISSINLSRKQKFTQSQQNNVKSQLQKDILNISKQTPIIQSIKKQTERFSFQSETPKSLNTATTMRIKNQSHGSIASYGNELAQLTLYTNSDSFKDDLYLEPQFSHQSNKDHLNQHYHHYRRQTTPSLI